MRTSEIRQTDGPGAIPVHLDRPGMRVQKVNGAKRNRKEEETSRISEDQNEWTEYTETKIGEMVIVIFIKSRLRDNLGSR